MSIKQGWEQEAESLARKICRDPRPAGMSDHDYDRMKSDARCKLAAILVEENSEVECFSDGEPYREIVDPLAYALSLDEVLKSFAEKPEGTSFAQLFEIRYKLKLRGRLSEKLKDGNFYDAKGREKNIRHELRKIALSEGMESKAITKALKFNLLNHRRVHEFLAQFGYSAEEMAEFDRDVFNRRTTVELDRPVNDGASRGDEGSAQNRATADTAVLADYDNPYLDAVDKILDITYDDARKKGRKAPVYMGGYWTICFIRSNMSEQRAEERQKYIRIVFFHKNNDLYAKEDKNMLMGLMAMELVLKPDSWRKVYCRIQTDVLYVGKQL